MVIAIFRDRKKAAGGSEIKGFFGVYHVYPGSLFESPALLPTI
jgi:hypothetical protein